MADFNVDEHIQSDAQATAQTELIPHSSPETAPLRPATDRRILELLSPTREGLCLYLLAPRHVTSDVWSKVIRRTCHKDSA
ncbi:MAG: hypothetical protein IT209_02495 [Armatimonadetes bacterium]|nr:hypothetical protein [Armatimonadota bacterium]